MSTTVFSRRALIGLSAIVSSVAAAPSALGQVQVADLVAAGGAASHKYGSAVARSGDYVAIGAPEFDNGGTTDVGRVYVYRRISGDTWGSEVLLAPQLADQQAFDRFGFSVALSGTLLVVGAPTDDGPNTDQGAVYVFTRTGPDTWSTPVRITPAEGAAGDNFGHSVAIDGTTIVVGAPFRNTTQADAGRAYVYVQSGPNWVLESTLNSGGTTPSGTFGISVGVSGDRAVVGAPAENSGNGFAYFFARSGGLWGTGQQVARSTVGGSTVAFGRAVAISGDGALIGSPQDDQTVSNSGSVRAFRYNGASWIGDALHIFSAAPAVNDQFGFSVSLDGTLAVIGAPFRDGGGFLDSGRAFFFEDVSGAWSQFGLIDNPSPTAGDEEFGTAVAVAGTTAFVGAPGDAANRGRAYGYKRALLCDSQPLAVTTISPAIGSTLGGATVTISGSGLNPGSQITFRRGLFSYTVPVSLWLSCNSIQVVTPAFPPLCNCATNPSFAVDVVVNNGSAEVTRQNFYTYTSSGAATVTINPPGTTAQSQIDGATDGTCVVFTPGIYQVNLVLDDSDDRLTLVSTNLEQPQLTRLRGGSSLSPTNPTFNFTGAVTDTSLCGLNIVLGNSGVAVVGGAKAYLFKNRIENNIRTGNGGGVRVSGAGSYALIDDNAIVLNRATASGGGVSVEMMGEVRIVKTQVTTNIATGGGGGGLFLSDAKAYIASNDFLENSSGGTGGGGLYLANPTDNLTIVNNRIASNVTGGPGAGIFTTEADDPGPAFLISVNDISNNTGGGGAGAGIHLGAEVRATVTYNRIDQNLGSGDGAGVYCFDATEPLIKNNLISNNDVDACNGLGGGVYVGLFNLAEVRDNLIKGNLAQRGGGLICLTKSEPYIYRNVFDGNVSRNYCSPIGDETYGPGVQVGDRLSNTPVGPAPIILNNTYYENTGVGVFMPGRNRPAGEVGTASIHGLRIGLFQPNWINNVIADGLGTRWGITTDDRRNTGVRIDFNLWENLFDGTSGDEMDPFINIAGQPPFINNRGPFNPLFRNPGNCDFTPVTGSQARISAEGGGFGGAVRPDRVLSFAGAPLLVEDISNALITGDEEERLASPAAVTFPNGSVPNGTEVYVQVVHYRREFNGPASSVLTAGTLYASSLTFPHGGAVAGGATLRLPTRVPLTPGTVLRLYRVDTSVNADAVFADTTITGTVDSSGLAANFSGVTALVAPSGRPWVYVGADIGPDCDANGVPDIFQIEQGTLVDADLDRIPDICQAIPCVADFDRDGQVGLADIAVMIGDFDTELTDLTGVMQCDLDGDGRVALSDVAIMIIRWGPCRPMDQPTIPADPL